MSRALIAGSFALLFAGLLAAQQVTAAQQAAAPKQVTAPKQAAPDKLLDVVARVPTAGVTAGQRVTVTLRLTPGPGLHVYAPGVVGYKVIALTVSPQPGVLVGKTAYPTPESYYYAPLKETVLVYQKQFVVSQELTIDTAPASRAALKGKASLVVQGSLAYQACDDKLCYPPRKVPVSWTLPLKAS
jgi:DsbC/DsbD-like thiol-disulfide interchange protein